MSTAFAVTGENQDLITDLEALLAGDWPEAGPSVAAAMIFGVWPSDRALDGWQGWSPRGGAPCPLAGGHRQRRQRRR